MFPVICVFLSCLVHVLLFPPSERVGIRCDPLNGSCRLAPSTSLMYVSISNNSYIHPYLFVCVLPKHSPDYVTESSGATPCSKMVTILESLEASLRKVVLINIVLTKHSFDLYDFMNVDYQNFMKCSSMVIWSSAKCSYSVNCIQVMRSSLIFQVPWQSLIAWLLMYIHCRLCPRQCRRWVPLYVCLFLLYCCLLHVAKRGDEGP